MLSLGMRWVWLVGEGLDEMTIEFGCGLGFTVDQDGMRVGIEVWVLDWNRVADLLLLGTHIILQ